jgi:hypothetical protein
MSAHADFLEPHLDPTQLNLGTTCLMTCSSSLFRRVLELVPPVDDGTLWPYSTTPLRICHTLTGSATQLVARRTAAWPGNTTWIISPSHLSSSVLRGRTCPLNLPPTPATLSDTERRKADNRGLENLTRDTLRYGVN